MKLIKCKKPKNITEKNKDIITIKNEIWQGCYDTAGNYYEHNLTTGQWYKVEFETQENLDE